MADQSAEFKRETGTTRKPRWEQCAEGSLRPRAMLTRANRAKRRAQVSAASKRCGFAGRSEVNHSLEAWASRLSSWHLAVWKQNCLSSG
jgi:hypothetical protein